MSGSLFSGQPSGLSRMLDLPAFVLLLLDALAVFRLTRLIVEDHLPFGSLRDRIERRRPESLLAEWFTCPWCASLYVAPVVIALHFLFPGLWPYAAAVLAFSALAGLLATWEQRG